MAFVKRVFTAFRDFSLERKVFVMTSVVILLAVPLTGAFSYLQASRMLESYAYNAAGQTVSQLSANMNSELKNISDKLYFINPSDAMKTAMAWSQNKTNEPYPAVFNRVYELFAQIRANSIIQSIYMYTPKGEFYEGVPAEKRNIPFKETPYYAAIRSSATNQWVYSKEDPLFASRGDVISLITRPTTDLNYLEQESYLVITVPASRFVKNLQSIKLVDQGFSFILNAAGEPVIVSDHSPLASEFVGNPANLAQLKDKPEFYETKHGRSELLVNHKEVPFLGWQAVIVQPKEKLLQPVRYIQYFTLLLTCVLLVVGFLMNRFIARLVTKPIRMLQQAMNQVKQGDLKVRFHYDSRDEIGQLGRHFNEMIGQTALLLQRIVEESQAKRQAEMRALQAQINPHFLYNTLDELYWKSLEFQDKTASEIILALSRFFRLSLNRGQEETTVGKEMEHVEQYLKLVNYQYQRQFDYEIRMDERTAPVAIPKIILQPLAENCILHAFKDNAYHDSLIVVSSRYEEPGRVVLQVSDNGVGIPAEKVAQLNSASLDAKAPEALDEKGGYAIPNIRERLRYVFGDRASLHVESRPGQGTTVTIRIDGVKEALG